MLPPRFQLHRPERLADALELKDKYGEDAAFYAGGTELLIALKSRVLRYGHLIDIKRLPELRGVRLEPEGVLRIGALSTHDTLAGDALVKARFPGYAVLSDNVANIRVRVAGTIGGNLCFAEPHADPPTMLCAVGARLRLAGTAGERVMSIEDFILGEFTTARLESELLVSIEIPGASDGLHASYCSFGHLERPAVGVAAAYSTSGDERVWRHWVGAISGRPVRLPEIRQDDRAFSSKAGMDAALAEIALAARDFSSSLEAYDDLHGGADYKRHLVSVLAKRASETCLK